MKLTLKAPGSKHLRLKYDQHGFQLCYNFAFKSNLRRYTVDIEELAAAG